MVIVRPDGQDQITDAIKRLNASECARREAIEDLIRLGVVRSRRLVANLAEDIAFALVWRPARRPRYRWSHPLRATPRRRSLPVARPALDRDLGKSNS